jgi:hypothetical protein
MRTLRKLVFGETWLLPGGVAGTLLAGALVRRLLPTAWEHGGGFLVLAGVVTVFVASLARS